MSQLNLANLFTAADLSRSINITPNKYGRTMEMGLFPIQGVATSTILIEEANGSLCLLATEGSGITAGTPGSVGKEKKRNIRSFVIPKIVHEDVVQTKDVAAVRAFGGNEMLQVATLMNQRLLNMRGKHDITHEWLRMGALSGNILDADGSTVIYNLFTEYNISQKTVDFALGTAGTDIKAKCLTVVRWIEDNLLGDVMDHVHCLCSPEFFDAFTSHANVKAAFANYQEAAQRLGGDMRKGFSFAGIVFEEYRGNATGSDGANKKFITAGDARFFPVGGQSTFQQFVGPADFVESVNQLGQVYYAKSEPHRFGRGWDLHTQSNPLPLCMRPAVLVRGFSSN